MAHNGLDLKSLALGAGAVVLLGAAMGAGYMLRGDEGAEATVQTTTAPEGNIAKAGNAAATNEPATTIAAAPEPASSPVHHDDRSGPPVTAIDMQGRNSNPPPLPGHRLAVLMTENKPLFYVILGSYPDGRPVPKAAEQRMSQCLGVTPHAVTTGYFQGLAPNLQVQLFGGFTRAEAEKVHDWVLDCVPDAYIKQATWIGD